MNNMTICRRPILIDYGPFNIAATASFLGAITSTPKCPAEIFILLVNSPIIGGNNSNSGKTSLVKAPQL